MMRDDWPIIKHISVHHAPKFGLWWQGIPYVEITQDFLDRARKAHPRGIDEGLPEIPVFSDAVYDLPPVEGGRIWMRQEWWYAGSIYHEPPRGWPWRLAFPLPDEPTTWIPEGFDRIIMHELWITQQGRVLPLNTPLAAPISAALIIYKDGRQSWEPASDGGMYFLQEIGGFAATDPDHPGYIFRLVASYLRSIAAYLAECPEYVVEEQIAQPTPRKRKDPKPWTYNGLPRIVLLDPRRAPQVKAEGAGVGTHASPRPHQRRGHWSTLRHPKFRRNEDGSFKRVFIRPAWVGPKEWIVEGTRYRVVDSTPPSPTAIDTQAHGHPPTPNPAQIPPAPQPPAPSPE